MKNLKAVIESRQLNGEENSIFMLSRETRLRARKLSKPMNEVHSQLRRTLTI